MEVNGTRHILRIFPQLQLLNSDYIDFVLKRTITGVWSNMEKYLLPLPGFKMTWYYSGEDIKSESRFIHDDITVNFIRYSLMTLHNL